MHWGRKLWRQCGLLMVLLGVSTAGVFAAGVSTAWAEKTRVLEDLRFGTHAQHDRTVVEFSAKTPWSVFTLPSPPRLVIDVPALKSMNKPENARGLKSSWLSGYRMGHIASSTTRIVLDLKRPVKILRAFLLAPSQEASSGGFRLVIDTAPDPKATKTQRMVSQDWQAFAQNIKRKSTLHQSVVVKDKSKPLIVLDPGHGGPDPGGIGRSGIYEKHVVLEAAHLIKKHLEKSGRYQVRLTRDTDTYLPLRTRFSLADKWQADLFISIHADKAPSAKTRGATVFTLSEKASDAEAEKLAKRENLSDIIVGEHLEVHDPVVARVLLDLEQRSTMQDSAHFAQMLVEALINEKIKLVRNSHRFAGFAVLKSPSTPSVLLELGFLSNRQEEKLLQTRRHRTTIAVGVRKALDRYFAQKEQYARN